MSSLDYSILRIGSADGGSDDDITVSVLKKSLISFLRNNQSSIHDDSNNNMVELSNRYFDAKVALLTNDESVEKSSQVKEDGMLLAFLDNEAGTNSMSFDRLTGVHSEAEAADKCGDLLRLCIGIIFVSPQVHRSGGSKEYENEYSRRVLWCLDRGYEYIEADLSEQGQATGHDLREKDGFPRIIEAIQGTVWSSSIRKPATTTKIVTHLSTPVPPPISPAAQEPASPKAQSVNDEKTQDEVQKSSSLVSSEELPSSSMTNDSTNKFELVDSEESKEDLLMDEFDQVIREASRIRDASKSGHMNDEERRKRAGDAAMALMGLLDSMGFDDEDENDVYDSSDEEKIR